MIGGIANPFSTHSQADPRQYSMTGCESLRWSLLTAQVTRPSFEQTRMPRKPHAVEPPWPRRFLAPLPPPGAEPHFEPAWADLAPSFRAEAARFVGNRPVSRSMQARASGSAKPLYRAPPCKPAGKHAAVTVPVLQARSPRSGKAWDEKAVSPEVKSGGWSLIQGWEMARPPVAGDSG